MGTEKTKRPKKRRLPSKREYYAGFAAMDPDRPGYSEKMRKSTRALKEHPPAYEMIKKIYDDINRENGYR